MRREVIQVITLGHPIGSKTEQFLKRTAFADKADVKVFFVPLHIERFDKTFETINQVIDTLREQGADLSGRSRTFLVPPGSSTAAAVFVAAWAGLTGNFPEILNLIRRGPSEFQPSPEKPLLDLGEFSLQQAVSQGETSGIIDLNRVKNDLARKKREEVLLKHGAEASVRTL